MNKEQLYIWAAGIFDGEGTVGVYDCGHGQLRTSLAVSNTDPRMVLELQALFEVGSIRRNAATARKSALFIWSIFDLNAIQYVLTKLRPFLIVKGEEADIVLSLRSLDASIVPAQRQLAHDKLKEIKRNRLRVAVQAIKPQLQ